eukprot:6667804-Alexandrium_andersonii.AAC.1
MPLPAPLLLRQRGKALPATTGWVVASHGVPVCRWALGSGARLAPVGVGSCEAAIRESRDPGWWMPG